MYDGGDLCSKHKKLRGYPFKLETSYVITPRYCISEMLKFPFFLIFNT